MKRTKRLLTMLLTLVLCVGEISATGLKVFAADEKTITGLGTGAITDPVVLDDIYESWSGSFVYYGKYNGSDPTIYRVLDKDSYEFGVPGEGLFLDCDDTLFQAAHGRLVTEWKNSCIKGLLNGDGFLKKAGNFTAVEEDAIAESTKGSGTGALCGEKIFCLSEKEACSTKYGYLSGIDSSSLSKGGSWWLRDIREWANGGYYGSFINSQGQIMFPTDPGSAMDFEAGVSPAFNISLSSIISSTLVSGESGKTGAEYKLTLKDDNLLITAGRAKAEGNEIVIPYKITDNSDDVDPTQVSLVVTDGTWTGDGWSTDAKLLLYKKQESDSFSLDGYATFTVDKAISGTWGKDYHVYIFAEDVNGEKDTDYASEPVEVSNKEGDFWYYLWVGENRVTDNNMTSIPCDSGTASYDPETNTLTFKNAVINKGYDYSEGEGRYAAIYTKDSSLTIKGDLTIDPTALPLGATPFSGIFAKGSTYKGDVLTLDGNLTIKGYGRSVHGINTDIKINGDTLDLETVGKSVIVLQDADIEMADDMKVISPEGAAFKERTSDGHKVIELCESATSDTIVKKATIASTKPLYTVTFDMNGHGDDIDAVKVKEGKTVAEPTEPVADGYIFGGWYASKDCKDDEKYDFTKAVTGDITLYAKWTGVERTVTFDANGKTATDMPGAQKVENGKTATLPDKEPKAEGFKFAGWYKDAAGATAFDFSTPITADTTVYAKWVESTVETYTVTFDLNGKIGPTPAPLTVEKGKTATRPATDPTAEGYKFIDWYKEAACTNKYSFDTPVTADIIIYAGWEKISGPDDKVSALDPKPVVDETTKELYLVKGQKFTLDSSWSVDNSDKDKFKAYKKLISIGKKGNVSAKKPGDAVIIKKDAEGHVVQTISVNICKPELNKKTLTLEAGEKGNVGLGGYGDLEVYYYCASPDVATVAPDGTVTAVAKGTAKVTAYVNGSAYTRSVKIKETSAVKERTLHLSLDSSPKTVKLKGVKNTVWDYADGTTDDEKAVVSIAKAKITPKKAGTVTLTAKGDFETYVMTVKVDDSTIQPAHVDDKYDLKAGKGKNKYELAIKSGEELDISYADLDQPVVFKSNKPETAFIDENGHIEARTSGKAKFTAKVNGKSITITVNVK